MTDEQRELWGEVGDPDPPTEEGPRSRRAVGVGQENVSREAVGELTSETNRRPMTGARRTLD